MPIILALERLMSHMCLSTKARRGIKTLGAGVTGWCEPPDIGTQN